MVPWKRVERICAQFVGKRILVYGDVILDRYIFGEVERISPEAPVPVVRVRREELRLGGAGNVAANIDILGGQGLLLGITGRDGFAEEIAALKKNGNLVIRHASFPTTVKTRVISQRQQIVRIDREAPLPFTTEISRQLADAVAKDTVDGIIVSDYAKGAVNETSMKILRERAKELNIPLVVDPKPPHFHLYRGVSGITPNLKEAEEMVGRKLNDDAEVARAVNQIRKKFAADFAVVTRGATGISAGQRGRRMFNYPAFSHEVYDVTGAGDTVVAVLTLALVSGAELREAVALANAAASIVVERIGTSQVTVDELRQRLKLISRQT